MARARNIKPGFFRNELLVEMDFATRLLFIGLWTLADKAGRLEDRPKKIKIELFPADDVDVPSMLHALTMHGFITRYAVDCTNFIQINNFLKHQSPHHKEPESELPSPEYAQYLENENAIESERSECTNHAQVMHGSSMDDASPEKSASTPLIPDSLIPDSGFLIPDTDTTACASADAQSSQKTEPKPPTKKTPAIDYSSWPELPDDQILKDWLKARTKARAVHSQTAINAIGKELHKAVAMGYTVNQCGEEAATRGWRGFKAEWMQNSVVPANRNGMALTGNVTRFPNRQSVDDHNREVAARWAAGGDCYDQE